LERTAKIQRKTTETEIEIELNIDGSGRYKVETGIPFFDHMLELFAKHGLFDLTVKASGDLKVDSHHTVEDVGIVLGQAFKQALGDKSGIKRYGSSLTPMDETLVEVALDLSGRAFLNYNVKLAYETIGNFETVLVTEFLSAFVREAGLNLHIISITGDNSHHIIEAVFKGLAKALDEATQIDNRIKGTQSTKGII
jgi:imidazoleglycerol-phosphate dehydratase